MALVCYIVFVRLHNYVIVLSSKHNTGGIKPVLSASNVFGFVGEEALERLVRVNWLQQGHWIHGIGKYRISYTILTSWTLV